MQRTLRIAICRALLPVPVRTRAATTPPSVFARRRGRGPAVIDRLTGQVSLMFNSMPSVLFAKLIRAEHERWKQAIESGWIKVEG